MIYLPNGTKWAKNDKEFINTLFSKGTTATGFYKKLNNRVIFLNMQNEPIVALIKNQEGSFLVNCGLSGTKYFYQFGLSSHNEKLFGVPERYIDACKYIDILAENHIN